MFGNGTLRNLGSDGGNATGAGRPAEEEPGGYGRTEAAERNGGDRRSGQKRKKRTKGRIVIASLNMRGFSSSGAQTQVSEKWMRINQLIRDKKIAVLALQETHLTQERLLSLNTLFGATMMVLGSADVENTAGARGVAFAVNKRIVTEDDLRLTEILPGRAAILTFRWTGDRILNVLNVYAPNQPGPNSTFWSEVVDEVRTRRTRRPELMLGDFNLVESSIDRLPSHGDPQTPVENLAKMTAEWGMSDGWRVNNPRERAYSFMQQGTGSQSRIDRIYVTNELLRRAEDWTIEEAGFLTDHRLVSVSLANYKAPKTGSGRWAFPAALLSDGRFVKEMRDLGDKLQKDVLAVQNQTPERNVQKLYHEFKSRLRETARARAKKVIPKLDRKIEALRTDMKAALNEETPDEHRAAILQDKLTKLEIKRFDRKRRAVATKDWLQGETMSRYWTKLNAPQLPT
ncbi:DNase I-like protein, partial [Lentinus brumalis]